MWKEEVTDSERLQIICNALSGVELTKDTEEAKPKLDLYFLFWENFKL